jgi:hypothetical protein
MGLETKLVITYSSASVDHECTENKCQVIAGIKAMPDGAEDKHTEGFSAWQAIECNSSQPQLRLNVPMIEYCLDTCACLNYFILLDF